MPTHKSIRLEEHVYNNLVKRQLPRESISQILDRLLTLQEKTEHFATELLETLKGNKQ